ncbi:13848_t:CDS:2 [Rhizophagus irregularis]|nr:13848_t:CDS:2 [Rhizophagus irregularis]
MSHPKTDEEIVYSTNYNFTLNVETLLNNSTTTRKVMRLQRRKNLCYTPRPQNPFMLYRRDMAAKSEFVGLKSSEVSKKIGMMWKNETTEVKDLFNAMARLAEKHISSLLSNSTITRRSKRLQRSNLRNTPRPRPQNSFTLYRRNMAARSEFVGLKSSLKSKRIADLWRNETTEVRDLFNAMARLASR